jgi:subtilisin family serine protease
MPTFLPLSKTRLALRIALCAVGVALTTLQYSKAADDPLPAKVLWVSSSQSATDFANELNTLYLSLFNTKRLALKQLAIRQNISTDEILRSNSLVIGPIIPDGLRSLICDLNPKICKRDRTTTVLTGSINDTISGTIQGNLPSKSVEWSGKVGDVILLPDIHLDRLSKWVSYSKPKGIKIDDIVVNILGGCETLDDACRDSIVAYNKGTTVDFENPDWSETISLPVVAARTWIDTVLASPPSVHNVLPPVSVTAVDISKSDGPSKGVPNWNSNVGIGNYVDNPRNNSEVIQHELKFNHSGILGMHLFSTEEDANNSPVSMVIEKDFKERRDLIYKLMGFPYNDISNYPNAVRGGAIAVLDGWADQSHCAFPAGKIQFEVSSALSGTEHDCTEMQKADDDQDHGTHILGIIASRSPGDLEFGLNPYASVVLKEVDFNSLNTADEERAKAAAVDLGQFILELRPRFRVDLVNMSWGYVKTIRGSDPVEDAIGANNSVLFVAAAGNQGADTSAICDVRPACFNFPNVISVAALANDQLSPSLLTEKGKIVTNYGSRVDIAAPGEDVLSTIRYGRFGTLSGSSPAAAEVAAVASMLDTETLLKPIEIKNRLIVCSDMYPSLLGKLFGGALNAKCTLDYKHGLLRLNGDDPMADPRFGHFAPAATVKYENTTTSRVSELPIAALRGIQYEPNSQTSIIFYNENPSESASKLLKEEGIKFLSGGNQALFMPEIGSPQPIDLNAVRKFSSGG